MKRLTALCLLAVLFMAACGGAETPPEATEVSTTEELTVPLVDQELLIDGYNGSIAVTGQNDSTATFQVAKQAQGADEEAAQAHLDGITVRHSDGGGTYTMRVLSGVPEQTSVDLKAQVPYRTPLRLDLESGRITVEAVSAPIRAVVDNGTVDVKGAANDVDVEAGNGDVTVNMAGFREDTQVEIEVENGNIELVLPPSASATVEAVAQVGRVETSGLSLKEREEESTASGMRLTGQLGTGSGHIDVRTENGSITLRSGS